LLEWLQENINNLASTIILKSQILSIEVKKPENGGLVDNIINIEAEIKSAAEISKIETYINDRLVSEKTGPPTGGLGQTYLYREIITTSNLGLQNTLKIKAYDNGGHTSEKKIILYTKF